MKSRFYKILLTILFLLTSGTLRATPTGVLLDIFEIQATALADTSEQTIISLSENAMANFVNVYDIVDSDVNFSQINFATDPTVLIDTVDTIYDHPVIKSRLGVTSALGTITKAVDTIEAVQKIASIPGIAKDVFDIAANSRKAVSELNELIKGGQRATIVRNLLDYGAGRRSGKLTAMLQDIDQDSFWHIWNFINTLNDINDTNQGSVEDAMDLLIYMTKAEVAQTYSDYLSNGVWAKVTLQDYIVRNWYQAGIINDTNLAAFNAIDSYAIDPDDGLLGFSPKVFTRPASESFDLFSSSDRYASDYASYISEDDFELVVNYQSPNIYDVKLPNAIAHHPVQGKAISVSYVLGGTDIVATYFGMINNYTIIPETGAYQGINFDLSHQPATKVTEKIIVTVNYEDGSSLVSSDYLIFYPQVTDLEIDSLPSEWRSDNFDFSLKFCGDEVNYMTLFFKGENNTSEDSVEYKLSSPTDLGNNCRSYTVTVKGWDLYRYTGKNTNVSIWMTVANQTSSEYTKNLLDVLDTDNDKMPDSWELEHFNTLSEDYDDDYDNDGDSNGYEYYHLTDPTKEGFDGITAGKVFEPVQYEDGTWNTDCQLGSTYWAHVTIRNNCNAALYGRSVVMGNLSFKSGTLDLNGRSLTVKGDLIHSGGTLNVNGGTLIVEGDYRIQSLTEEGAYTHSDGKLQMTNESDAVFVAGDFITDSSVNHSSLLTAGDLDIKGDFTQQSTDVSGDGNRNFLASGTHKVILSGTGPQVVSFENSGASSSSFNQLLITNSQVSTVSPIVVTKLFEHNGNDLTLSGPGTSTFVDYDGDGVNDNNDAFPQDVSEWLDTDGDNVGNNFDMDDDGDGVPDSWEVANGFDPLDAADSLLDADEDGKSNLEEYLQGTDPQKSNRSNAVIFPIIFELLL